MGSQGNPRSWVPFDYNSKDCSQGFCSLYCPQWCYFMFPPPPPAMGFDDEDSKTNFSPLVIAIIGTLASAFLLVTYYTVISKYCGSLESLIRRGRGISNIHREGSNDNQNPSNQEAWRNSATGTGLDEALIKSITVCKYKKGDGFVQVTDCSVCLSEFQEGENVRLLPKCSHAFHLPCIDTWLKSHSTCPLCRANVVSSATTLPVQVVLPVEESAADTTTPSQENQQTNNHSSVAVDELERSCEEASEASDHAASAKTPTRYGSHEDIIIEIIEERVLPIRRSISMDASLQAHVSVADVLSLSEDEDNSDDYQLETRPYQLGVESSSKLQLGNHSRPDNCRALHSVMNPTAMKRSFSSSGRLLFSRNKRGRNINITIPM